MLSRILYGFLWLCSLLPLRILYFFSDICYFLLYDVVRYRRKVVRMNLEHSFPEKTQAERIVIEKRYYRHLCDLFVETYRMWHFSFEEMRRRCVFTNPEVVLKYFEQGKSVIGVLGHYGNWEWMSSFSLWMPEEMDFYTLYKPLHNGKMDRMMLCLRSRFKAKPVPRQDILRKIVENRRTGRLFLAGIIGDQTPNGANLNFWMQFLNQETPVLLGTEKIARKFNLPVISLRMRKIRRGYYEVDFVDLCAEPKLLEPGELTRMHSRMLESFIREVPELWLWSHRRWKHKPGERTEGNQ
ncbi:MAG: lysophospholipid acyltransferase family protein [Odoribacter sp.]|nr:lysophospholipid acyltransferase family protein [Odoribacter sp.]